MLKPMTENLAIVDTDQKKRTEYDHYFRQVTWLNSDDDAIDQCSEFLAATIGIGLVNMSTAVRSQLFRRFTDAGLSIPSIQHQTAVVDETSVLGLGCQIFANATVNPMSRLGQNTVINTGAIIEHECVIEDHAFIAPGAILCGQVTVGCGAIIGAGALCLPGSVIPEYTIVKAGSRFGS